MFIEKFLTAYSDKRVSRWHTPGHKGTLNPLDITEIYYGAGFPGGRIEEAEERAAEFYGAKKLRFLTGGSSIGIKAAIMSAEGDILAPFSCHQSVSEGCTLANKKLYTFGAIGKDGLPCVPTADEITDALKKHGSIGAVLIESPDYYGRCVSIDIVKIVKGAKKTLICDAAHGAHFPATGRLKGLSFADKADICNLSAHKTLDAYTQSAYLCINEDSLLQKIDKALRLLGTTSPSYLLLASLETAVFTAKNNAEEYERLYKEAQKFKKEVVCLKNDDFTRLTVDAVAYGLSGRELAERLYKKNIAAETDKGGYTVFIATPHETANDFKTLIEAIKSSV